MRDERGSGPDHMCEPPDPFGDDDDEDGGTPKVLIRLTYCKVHPFFIRILFWNRTGKPVGPNPTQAS